MPNYRTEIDTGTAQPAHDCSPNISCYLPERMAQPLLDRGRLFRVGHCAAFTQPAYMVFSRERDDEDLRLALEGLREFAKCQIRSVNERKG
jgi:hypothetical protein